MTRTLASLLLTVFAMSSAAEQGLPDDRRPANEVVCEIQELEGEFEQAVLEGDLKFFERTLGQDFTHTTQSGKTRSRAEWLANHKPGQSNYDALNVDQLTVRAYDDIAIVTGRISPQGRDSQGKPIQGRYRFLRVWVKQSERWQAVAFQSTRIADTEKGTSP